MRRLTLASPTGEIWLLDRDGTPVTLVVQDDDWYDQFKKLAEYEDLEEQGKLMKLPCAVGDTVWELCECDDGVYRIFPVKVADVTPYGSVRWINGKELVVWNVYATSNYADMYKNFYDFGKTVFLTKEEAEAALNQLQK